MAEPWESDRVATPSAGAGADAFWQSDKLGLDKATSIQALPWYESKPFGIGALPTAGDVVRTLPAVGGAVGGILGGMGGSAPGAVGGAAAGGAAGESWAQNIMRMLGGGGPRTSEEAAKAIATEGAIQGAAELGGLGLARAARGTGEALIGAAVRPSAKVLRDSPTVVADIVEHRLPVGASAKATAMRDESKSAMQELLQRATAGGTTFEAAKIAQPVLDLLGQIARAERVRPTGAQAQVEKMVGAFLDKNKGPLSPIAVQQLKEDAQKLAQQVYRAQGAGQHIPPTEALGAQFDAAIARGARRELETIPGVAEANARTHKLGAAAKALEEAEKPTFLRQAAIASAAGGLGSGLAGEGSAGLKGAAGGVALAAVLNPRSLSRIGLALTSREAQALAQQFPRVAEWLYQQIPQDYPQGGPQ